MSNRSNTEKPEKRKRLGSKEEDYNMTPLIEVQNQILDKMSEIVNAMNELKEQVKLMNQNRRRTQKKIEKANCITKSSSDVVKELGEIATIQTNTMSGLQNAQWRMIKIFFREGGSNEICLKWDVGRGGN